MSRFNLGFLTAVFANSLAQDALGLEYVVRNWIDPRASVPLAIAGLLLVLWTEVKQRE